ncbi:glycosyl hydrolase [Vallitalea longa]|uniref:Glycosyl hydrolase n=1 Tax=Vallitalea longa TaxID=2936439 RepID=A0A9W5YA75_9FIRM|nr:glycosyl hydrolase family 65 protein [Vallitalea longa]GKX27568.1 glycosyl hydrolase [Vallitalea longa]
MNWNIEEEGYDKKNIEFFGSKFCIGNGYYGYRGSLEEYTKEQLTACTLSEIYDDKGNGWRELVNVQNPLYTVIKYKNTPLTVLESQIKSHKQSLNIKNGVHTRCTEFITSDNKIITVESQKIASIDNKNLLVMKYCITANEDMDIEITTKIDEDIWDINGPHFSKSEKYYNQDILTVKSITIEKGNAVAVSTRIKCSDDRCSVATCEDNLSRKILVKVQKGIPFYFDKFAVICKDTDCRNVCNDSIRICQDAYEQGFDNLIKNNNEKWAKRWDKFDVNIEGDDLAALSIRYSIYLLLISAPFHTDKVAIPARGLSGQVYKGAMFWDTEIYMLQLFAYSYPDVAKNLVMYRINNLQGALKKAKEYGYDGAFYPWESQETGEEGCTHYNLVDIFTGRKMRTYFRDKQIHISADVVYGIKTYMDITGDKDILLEGGAEVILECARFFYSYSYYKKSKNRYELLDVTCADEYHERVNNNAYTNYMVKITLECAVYTLTYLEKNYPDEYLHIIDKLNYEDDIRHIREMNDLLYLPIPNEDGIIEQFDGYFKQEDLSIDELYKRIIKPNEYLGSPVGLAVNTQVIKQADVILMLTILRDRFSREIKHDNWEYYEPRTEHGSSLSACVYALLAAEIGKVDWAYKYFMKTGTIDLQGAYKLYLGDLYIGGTHPAANGGTWQVAVLGFGGLHLKGDSVELTPRLPEKWNSLSYKFTVKNNTFSVNIDKRQIIIEADKNNKNVIDFQVYEKQFSCEANEIKKINYEFKGE